MLPISLSLIMLSGQSVPDPNLLPIGPMGTVKLAVGEIRSASGKKATADDIAATAEGKTFVLLGESHTSPAHHKLQAEIIEALAKRGRHVTVGFEMFTRPKQDSLAPWTLGQYTEQQFLEETDWKHEWGFDFGLYRPIFATIREYRLPMVALNVPRKWVSRVGKGGYQALTAGEKEQLPADLFLGNKDHRQIFGALMGGHPPMGDQGENIYAAQVLWDEGMADTALKFVRSRPGNPKNVFVVIAGSGHVMYGQGIAYRIKRHSGLGSLVVTMVDGDQATAVSKGLGDFVYLSASPGLSGVRN